MATAAKPVPYFQLKNILFATDFSPCSEAALPLARSLAGRFGSVLHVVHVLPPVVPVAPLDYVADYQAHEQQAEQQMAQLLLRQPLKGVTHRVSIERGWFWHVLESIIAERAIDLIVLGTRGRGGLTKLVLGSTAEEIFRRAPCPVLTVGPNVPAEATAAGMKSILYATDFSSGSLQALPYATGLARENQAELMLLHVLSVLPVVSPEELQRVSESCRQRLLGLLAPGVEQSCKPRAAVLFGSAADGILRAAQECQAQLIVMGANMLSRAMGNVHLPWATAHRVVCEARCPVLTVRA